MFDKVGGIAFLITCDFEISKLPIKLSFNVSSAGFVTVETDVQT